MFAVFIIAWAAFWWFFWPWAGTHIPNLDTPTKIIIAVGGGIVGMLITAVLNIASNKKG